MAVVPHFNVTWSHFVCFTYSDRNFVVFSRRMVAVSLYFFTSHEFYFFNVNPHSPFYFRGSTSKGNGEGVERRKGGWEGGKKEGRKEWKGGKKWRSSACNATQGWAISMA